MPPRSLPARRLTRTRARPPETPPALETGARPWSAAPRLRPLAGAVLALMYAAPLFVPPPAATPHIPDAGLHARLYPGVPWPWVALRLAALAGAALLLASARRPVAADPFRPAPVTDAPLAPWSVRMLALALAALQVTIAPFAARLGPLAQVAYVLALFAPALVLALPRASVARVRSGRRLRRALPVVLVIVAWCALRVVTDLRSDRLADMTDAWAAIYAIARFDAGAKNVLTDLLFESYPGVGAMPMLLHGVPLVQAGIVALDFRTMQLLQIAWTAATAAGIALLARALVGPRVAALAVAVFLFAPFTRMVVLFPSPFIVGPLYATAVVGCALVACRRRSEAALAALGACTGIALTYPGVIPVAAFAGLLTVWFLRRSWRELWVGWVAAALAFVAVVLPALPVVFATRRVSSAYGTLYGLTELLEPIFAGQLSIRLVDLARQTIVWRPLDTLVALALSPFAHPRMPIKLWGDVLFDPLGSVLIAIGVVACLRAVPRSSGARILLLLLGAALAPAVISLHDRLNISRAVALPVPVALLAAAGWQVVARRFVAPGRRAAAGLVAAVAVAVGGTALFDVVNPRILRASAFGVMFQALDPRDAERTIVLDYPRSYADDVFWLFTGPITAFAGERPVGFFEYDGGALPVAGFAAERKDLLFWSPGYDDDFQVTRAVCRQVPGATIYELWDATGFSRVLAARLGDAPWRPRAGAGVWSSWTCPADDASG